MVRCDICEKIIAEDDALLCDCERRVCSDCMTFTREYETGAQIEHLCMTCVRSISEAESALDWTAYERAYVAEMESERAKEQAAWEALSEDEKWKQMDKIEDTFEL